MGAGNLGPLRLGKKQEVAHRGASEANKSKNKKKKKKESAKQGVDHQGDLKAYEVKFTKVVDLDPGSVSVGAGDLRPAEGGHQALSVWVLATWGLQQLPRSKSWAIVMWRWQKRSAGRT